MKKGFEDEFDVQLIKGELTEDELELAENFKKECFSTEEWNNRR